MASKLTGNGKWMRWALGLSLGVNLLVAGLVAGAAYRFDGPHGGAGGNMRDYGTAYIIALEKERRRDLFNELRRNKPAGHLTRTARRALYSEVVSAIRAEPFDIARVRSALDQQANASVAVQQAVQDAWLKELASMDDTARAAYAGRLQEVLSRPTKREPDRRKPSRND
ncbi:periplasmic heavy metal sensor [uncultured Sulfitobacter sp.]|uniref:periplasmic heavy metal sensor n=1 Tax=uncultured Sulfitobacter sp. TaxID=191468 RepID=UPI0030DB1CA5|tara:strand:+ start:114409 stop:114915 length:507 start_codon:yes stop_codon:yes gene_type:complete